MFQHRRQAALGNINLGSLSAPPSYQDMTFLMDQAARYRGRFVEVTWTVPKSGAVFQLTAKFVPSQAQPTWMLYRGSAADSELVWGHTSNDLTLMHNLVSLECEKVGESHNTISASSMDNLLTGNRSAGAFAGALGEPAAADKKAVTGAKPKPAEPPVTFAPSQSPADTWLKNLKPVKLPPEGAPAAETAAPVNPAPRPAQPASGGQPQLLPHQSQTGVARDTRENRQPEAANQGSRIAIAAGGTQELATLAAGSTDGSLDGNLVNITIPKLLSYLSQNGATGRLSLKTSSNACDVYMRDGALLHAASLDARGEFALLDAATWTDGEFSFKPLDSAAQQSLSMSSQDFIVACQGMLEYSRFLQQCKLHAGSYPSKVKSLTRQQFEQQAKEFGLLEGHQLWKLFDLMDGNRCLSDVLRLNPMMRAEWIPAMYTLLKAQLISLSDSPKTTRPGMFLEGAQIDQQAIDAFMSAIADPLDLALRRHAFLFLLQQEHFRYERSGAQYALALFSFGTTEKLDTTLTPFSKEAMRLSVERIARAKRKLDVIGHFDATDYALLLPETDSAGAAVFANRICDLLMRPPITPELANQSLVASFGIASVPHDVRDLSGLLAATRAAQQRSKMMGAPVCVYGDG